MKAGAKAPGNLAGEVGRWTLGQRLLIKARFGHKMTCKPRPERPGSEKNPGRPGPLRPGQHMLSNHIPPDKDILNGARLRQREIAHLRSPKRNKHGGFSPATPPPRARVLPPGSTRLGCHQQTAETLCPQCGFGRVRPHCSGICASRTTPTRAHVRWGRWAEARPTGRRCMQTAAAWKGFPFAEGLSPKC